MKESSYQTETVNASIKKAKYKDAPRTSKHGKPTRLLMPREMIEWRRSLQSIYERKSEHKRAPHFDQWGKEVTNHAANDK